MSRRLFASLAVLISLSAVLAVPVPAQAADGIAVRGDVLYTADALQGALHTELTLGLQNVTPPTRSGTSTTNYFYNAYSFGVHRDAVNIEVLQDGAPANFEVTLNDEGTRRIDLSFNNNLNYQRSTTFSITYDLPGGPRSDNPFRVNGALTSAFLFAWGDPGLSSVTLRLPQGQEPEFTGAQNLLPSPGEEATWAQAEIEDSFQWFAFVDARNDGALTIEPLSVTNHPIVVRAWPGDTEWLSTVKDVLTDGQPVMQEILGLEWPVDETLTVQESIDPTLSGYGGWFVTADALIEIGEHLDADLILHELSHAWFNGSLFEERWIGEGLAEYYGRKTAELLGEGGGIAAEPLSFHPSRFDLNSWPGVGESDQEEEIWGYETAFYIIQTLAEEIGEESMREVLDTAYNHNNPYLPSLTESRELAGWQRFLDILEEVGGSSRATDLFSEWAVAEPQTPLLDQRTAVRLKFHNLVVHADTWELPIMIAENLSQWEFEEAEPLIQEAEVVLDLRDSAEDQAGDLGLIRPTTAEEIFEAESESFEQANAAIDSELASLDLYASANTASSADRSWKEELGLIREDLTSELEDAKAAFESGQFKKSDAEAQELIDLIAGAQEKGEATLGAVGAIAGIMFIAGAVPPLVRRRRRRGDPAVEGPLYLDPTPATPSAISPDQAEAPE
jgi:hypothetical protein